MDDIRINFFGDFKCDDTSSLLIDNRLKKLLSLGDINIVNFEAPVLSGKRKKIVKDGPAINQDVLAPKYLTDLSFNAISLANNHVMDYGEDGLIETIKNFPSGVVVGAGLWEDVYRPLIIEVKQKKVAIIAVTHHEFGVLSDEIQQKNRYGTAWMSHPAVDEIIVDTKRECDFIFIYVHAGYENESYPLPELRTLYRHFINMGADGVFASHPHVPQPWENYKNKIIAYSLGNFCFDNPSVNNDLWYWSLVMSLEIKNDGSLKVTPHFCYFNSQDRSLSLMDDDKIINNHMNKINDIFSDDQKYLNEINFFCKRNIDKYMANFSLFGFPSLSWKSVIKQCIKRLFKLENNIDHHVLNNIRCESHRWLIERYIREKHQLR